MCNLFIGCAGARERTTHPCLRQFDARLIHIDPHRYSCSRAASSSLRICQAVAGGAQRHPDRIKKLLVNALRRDLQGAFATGLV